MESNDHFYKSRQLRRSGLKVARFPDIHIVTPRIMGSNHRYYESRRLRHSGLKIARCPDVRIVTLCTTESILFRHGTPKLLRGSVESLQFPVLPSMTQCLRGCSHPRFLCSRPHHVPVRTSHFQDVRFLTPCLTHSTLHCPRHPRQLPVR